MLPARPARLLGWGLGSLLVSCVLLAVWIDGGGHTPRVPWTLPLVLVLATLVVVLLGWPVRRWVREGQRLVAGDQVDRRSLDPIVAARTLTLALAAAHAGALVAGWFGGQILAEFLDVPANRTERVVLAAVAGAAGLLLCLAGLLVQRWCRVPPDDQTPGAA